MTILLTLYQVDYFFLSPLVPFLNFVLSFHLEYSSLSLYFE